MTEDNAIDKVDTDSLAELYKLFEEAKRRIKPENHKKWLAYCLGMMSGKMDKADFETMRDGIKKYVN